MKAGDVWPDSKLSPLDESNEYAPESGSGEGFFGVTTEWKLSLGLIFTSLTCCYRSSVSIFSIPSVIDNGDFSQKKHAFETARWQVRAQLT